MTEYPAVGSREVKRALLRAGGILAGDEGTPSSRRELARSWWTTTSSGSRPSSWHSCGARPVWTAMPSSPSCEEASGDASRRPVLAHARRDLGRDLPLRGRRVRARALDRGVPEEAPSCDPLAAGGGSGRGLGGPRRRRGHDRSCRAPRCRRARSRRRAHHPGGDLTDRTGHPASRAPMGQAPRLSLLGRADDGGPAVAEERRPEMARLGQTDGWSTLDQGVLVTGRLARTSLLGSGAMNIESRRGSADSAAAGCGHRDARRGGRLGETSVVRDQGADVLGQAQHRGEVDRIERS